jgi:NAD(P)H-dependent flavin oxidoreductase YrpB (nitropropane dioxygenase family)
MLRTSLCDLLGIDVPIILAGMGAGATSAQFAAAVSNQGGLGSVGSLFRTSDAVTSQVKPLRCQRTSVSGPTSTVPPRKWRQGNRLRY